MSATTLAVVERPNGKIYRPRKLVVAPVCDQDDFIYAVVVFGTREWSERVQQLADDYLAWQLGSTYVARKPYPVWWRDGFRYGQRTWIDDPERGRAGLLFDAVERTP